MTVTFQLLTNSAFDVCDQVCGFDAYKKVTVNMPINAQATP